MEFRIKNDEITGAIRKLKNRKATGLDLISNEMIRFSQFQMLPLLSKLFNLFLTAKRYSSKWCNGYIVPIPKPNDHNSPANFRGLIILNCLDEVFNMILNERIINYLNKKGIMDDKQIGLKKKSRTSDHMFILRTLIEKYTQKKRQTVFVFCRLEKSFRLYQPFEVIIQIKEA